MASLDDETKANIEVLKALDEAIEKGPWEHSPFFKGIGKKLRDLRDKFQQELGLDNIDIFQLETISIDDSQYTEVYVSLYQAEGTNIRKWLSVIVSLAGLVVSRPIYKNEEDIKAAIRAKEYKQNDGYVVVKVLKEDVMPLTDDNPRLDKEGRELLMLREGAIKLQNIIRFVHMSGEYLFTNNTLVKQIA